MLKEEFHEELNALNEKIEIEISERKEADSSLNDKIEKEIADRINENSVLNEKIEQEIIKLSNRKEEVLIVKVPNTFKRNYNKLISKLLILLGCLIIISTKKKTTNC